MHSYLSIKDLADLLAVRVSTVHRWRWKGIGPPSIKIGGTVRYAQEDVERWIADHRDAKTEAR